MKSQHFASSLVTFSVSFLLIASAATTIRAADSDKKPNILFISVADLRPQTRADGDEFMVTPNMDRLAGSGRLFHRHDVQAPTWRTPATRMD